VYVRELQVRYRQRRLPGAVAPLDRFLTPRDAALAFTRLLQDEVVEVCGLFCLSTRNQVLAYHELSRGSVNATLVHPRDVFKIALLANATAIVVGHNHPSGDPTPSPDDLVLTRRLKDAGTLMGIELVDHVIVTPGQYISLKETGSM
jgi:DNA repair protein RadC